jgi:hypothetical protein
LPSRQLRTTPSEKPHIRAISVTLPTRWISTLMRSAKVLAGSFVEIFCMFIAFSWRMATSYGKHEPEFADFT